jgi:hypothetical protein
MSARTPCSQVESDFPALAAQVLRPREALGAVANNCQSFFQVTPVFSIIHLQCFWLSWAREEFNAKNHNAEVATNIL